MSTLYANIDSADWSFMGTWREQCAIDAAENVARAGGLEFSDELDDLKQHALLYVATHSKEINKIEARSTFRQHLYRRLVQDYRRGWEQSREIEQYGDETDLYAGGV